VPKVVVSAVVIDIIHPDTADTIAPPPVDPVAVTVEIRRADVGPSRSVKLRTHRPALGMITFCFERIPGRRDEVIWQ
jgi:hypothetical protein